MQTYLLTRELTVKLRSLALNSNYQTVTIQYPNRITASFKFYIPNYYQAFAWKGLLYLAFLVTSGIVFVVQILKCLRRALESVQDSLEEFRPPTENSDFAKGRLLNTLSQEFQMK